MVCFRFSYYVVWWNYSSAYTTYTEEDYKYLIEDCEPALVIISNNEMFKKLKNIIEEKIFIKKVITLDKLDNVVDNLNKKESYLDFETIIKKDLNEKDKIKNNNLKRISPACIIYTSGTGKPKGVILSHGGILNNIVGACEILKPIINTKPIFLTWLPLFIHMSIVFNLFRYELEQKFLCRKNRKTFGKYL